MQVINSDYYSGSFHIFISIREEVAKKFGEKLLEYSSKGTSLKFIGYCLPDISF
jgi:hypothetical protein